VNYVYFDLPSNTVRPERVWLVLSYQELFSANSLCMHIKTMKSRTGNHTEMNDIKMYFDLGCMQT